jgi:hypothetical protein
MGKLGAEDRNEGQVEISKCDKRQVEVVPVFN